MEMCIRKCVIGENLQWNLLQDLLSKAEEEEKDYGLSDVIFPHVRWTGGI